MGIKKLKTEDKKKIAVIAVSAGVAFVVSGAYYLGYTHGFRQTVSTMLKIGEEAKKLGDTIPLRISNTLGEKAFIYVLPEATEKFTDTMVTLMKM